MKQVLRRPAVTVVSFVGRRLISALNAAMRTSLQQAIMQMTMQKQVQILSLFKNSNYESIPWRHQSFISSKWGRFLEHSFSPTSKGDNSSLQTFAVDDVGRFELVFATRKRSFCMPISKNWSIFRWNVRTQSLGIVETVGCCNACHCSASLPGERTVDSS